MITGSLPGIANSHRSTKHCRFQSDAWVFADECIAACPQQCHVDIWTADGNRSGCHQMLSCHQMIQLAQNNIPLLQNPLKC